MAKYLIRQEDSIVDVVEAKSIKEAVEMLNPSGNGSFLVYTLQGEPRVVGFTTVTETRLSVGEDQAVVEEE